MVVYAAVQPAGAISLVIGIVGLGGLVFTALRFRRDDTTAIVTQQSTITTEMKTLNDELRLTTDALRAERDELKERIAHLQGQVDALRIELHEAHWKGSSFDR
jgi:hypothetical protein